MQPLSQIEVSMLSPEITEYIIKTYVQALDEQHNTQAVLSGKVDKITLSTISFGRDGYANQTSSNVTSPS